MSVRLTAASNFEVRPPLIRYSIIEEEPQHDNVEWHNGLFNGMGQDISPEEHDVQILASKLGRLMIWQTPQKDTAGRNIGALELRQGCA